MGRSGRAFLLVVVMSLLAPGAPPAAEAAPQPKPRETSLDFLRTDEISLPERSRVFEHTDLVDGCGDPPPGRISVDGRADEWRTDPTMIAGTGRYDAGEYVWTDYPYDDDGTGTFQYPGEGTDLEPREGAVGTAPPLQQRYGSNAADVVELRAAADGSFLYVLARFNFLSVTDSTVLGLAFDLDRDPSTGFASWPRGARLDTPGTDLFVTAYGTCALVTTSTDEYGLDETGGAVRVGTDDNVLELAIPLPLLAGHDHVRLAGGAGLWDPDAGAWMPVEARPRTSSNSGDRPVGAQTADDPAVFNLLFRDDETTAENGGTAGDPDRGTPRTFQSRRQNDVLAGGTTGPYALDLELDRLHPGAPDDPIPVRRGDELDFTRVYRSKVDAEGVVAVSNSVAVFLGRYQPYGVYVPSCYEDATCQWPGDRPPLVALAHGGSGSHIANASRPSIAEGGTDLYGIQAAYEELASRLGPVVVRPLGRGQREPWYRGYGEVDVLESVLAAERAYDTDPDRRIMSGASLGGYATLRLGSLYPDLWAGAFAHCPAAYENSISGRYTGNVDPATQPFVIDPLLPAFANTPLRQASGTLDPLTPINSNRRLRDAALAAGLDYRYTEYLTGSHCFDIATGGRPWPNFHTPEMIGLAASPRTERPARVRYGIDPRHYPADPESIGLYDIRDVGPRYHGAWWASDLEVRPEVEERALAGGAGEEVVAFIDARSHALGGWDVDAASCGEGAGVGLGTGNPDIEPWGPTPHTYTCQEQIRSGEPAPLLDLEVRNLASGTISPEGAGFDGDFTIRSTGDGAFTLRLEDADVDASGPCVGGVTSDDGDTVLELDLGPETCVVEVT